MKRIATCALALSLALLPACKKDKAVGPKPAEITGLWHASKVEYVSKSAPSTRVDLIAAGGSATARISEGGAFEWVLTEAGQPPDTTTGTWRLSGDLFEVTPTGMAWAWSWDATLSGSTLTLTGADMEFDFDHDGTPDPADQNTVLVR
jgi:hypothetical protein